MLTREELKLLLAAPMRRRNALAIRILLATAVRSAELYQAKWADVDLDGAQWHIPKSKTGAAMDIPLAPVVVDWFRELRTLAGHSDYVLPAHSRSRAARHGGDTHLNEDKRHQADVWHRAVLLPQWSAISLLMPRKQLIIRMKPLGRAYRHTMQRDERLLDVLVGHRVPELL